MRADFQKIMPHKPLNSYSQVVHWVTVRLTSNLQCIIGFQNQTIDFTNKFSQAYIKSGETVFIELPRDLKTDGVQCDVNIRLKKAYMVKPKLHTSGMKSCEMVCYISVL